MNTNTTYRSVVFRRVARLVADSRGPVRMQSVLAYLRRHGEQYAALLLESFAPFRPNGAELRDRDLNRKQLSLALLFCAHVARVGTTPR